MSERFNERNGKILADTITKLKGPLKGDKKPTKAPKWLHWLLDAIWDYFA